MTPEDKFKTPEDNLKAVITTGDWTVMNQIGQPDGSKNVVVLAKSGKAYKANMKTIYPPVITPGTPDEVK